jgi:hypothetical protein
MMSTLLTLVVILLSGSTLLVVVALIGLQVQPRPFAPYPRPAAPLETIPISADLPAPVTRWIAALYGDEVPVITTAVLSGRLRIRFGPVVMPGRFRITHRAGYDYRHYLEVTLFGLPMMKINEWYLDGKGRMELPFGVVENEPKIDSAANQGLWAESMWLAALLVTDQRLSWQAIDDETAVLTVPFGEHPQSFTAHFNPHTGMLRLLETMRYRDASHMDTILWINEVLGWEDIDGWRIPVPATVTWLDQGLPWSTWWIEEVVYNADVSETIKARGV